MKGRTLAIAALLFLFLPHVALAADPLAMPAADMSIEKLLKPIFGSLFGGGDAGPLGAAIEVFNSACLLVGGVMLGYVLAAGTMQTAHDGQMLGKRWSSMWIPIRASIASAMIIPVNSYCVAQMLVGWITMQSVAMADSIWAAFASSAFSAQATVPTALHPPKVDALAFGILRSEVCLEGYKKIKADSPEAAAILGAPVIAGDFATTRTYGMSGQSSMTCGGVAGANAAGTAKAANKLLGWFGIGAGAAEKADAIVQAHAQAAATLEAAMQPIAAAIVAANGSGARAQYEAAINAYENTVADAARAQLGGDAYFKAMADNATKDGWVVAGCWFMKYLSLLDNTMKALQSAPTPIAVEKDMSPEIKTSMDMYFAALEGSIKSPSKKSGIDNQLSADKARDDSQSGIGSAVLDKVASAFDFSGGGFFNWATEADSGAHPLMVAMNTGHMIITAGVSALAIAVGLSALPGIGTGLIIAAVMPITTMIVFGAALAYILPMLPFITFTGAVAGWLMVVAEAVIGAPLWMIAHLKPGEDLHSGASSGYIMILQLLLTPPLLIFGFIFSLVISYPLGQYINQVFFSTFTMAQGGFVGIIGVISSIGLFAALQHQLIKWSFGIMPRISQEVIKWLGGHAQSALGEGAQSLSQSEHRSDAAVTSLGATVLAAGQSHQAIKQGRRELARDRAETQRHQELMGQKEPEAAKTPQQQSEKNPNEMP